MPGILSRAVLGACFLAAAAQSAGATTLFSNDFTAGIGPHEDMIGNFTATDGYLGHHNGYMNNEDSIYRISLDFAGVTNAFIDFDFWINSQNIFDGVQVRANNDILGGYTGNGAGHARFGLDTLTQPGVAGPSTISFEFISDSYVTAGGFQIDNVAITGDRVSAPTGGVPEPASWAMMVIGFGTLGATMRSRRPVGSLATL